MALQNVGPAVLNGGVSTFLAMVLLAASKSYVFTVFFKVSIYFFKPRPSTNLSTNDSAAEHLKLQSCDVIG